MSDDQAGQHGAQGETVAYADGKKITTYPNGATVTESSDGTTVTQRDGKTITEKPDGTKITEANGFVTTEKPGEPARTEPSGMTGLLLGGLALTALTAAGGPVDTARSQALSGEDSLSFLHRAVSVVNKLISDAPAARGPHAPARSPGFEP